jgi:undecaprenyl-diphosphatase
VRLRGYEVDPPFGTVQRRIEHEGLALLRAGAAGTNTPRLHGILATEDHSAMLVMEQVRGVCLTDLDPSRVDRTLLDRLWEQLGFLEDAHIAHRNLALENVVVDHDGVPFLVDFDEAELAATARQRRRDIAQLLVETSMLVGVDEAVDAAIDGLGADRVAAEPR